MSRIRVTIDRLALKGFDPAERTALVEGLRRELERVLIAPGGAAHWKKRRTPVVRVNVPAQAGLSGSRALGGSVAQAIGKGVKP